MIIQEHTLCAEEESVAILIKSDLKLISSSTLLAQIKIKWFLKIKVFLIIIWKQLSLTAFLCT